MKVKTYTHKGHDGWEAHTEIVLDDLPEGQRILKLRTAKHDTGVLSNSVRAFIRSQKDGYTTEMSAMFEDYSKRSLAAAGAQRITKNIVKHVHVIALKNMPHHIENAKAFYLEKDAQPA